MRNIFYTFLASILFCVASDFVVQTYSDTTHTGIPGTINISTAVPDRTRNIGDKLNENFRMLSSTINTLQTRINTLDTATGTINARFTNVASSDIIDGEIRGSDLAGGIIFSSNISGNTLSGTNMIGGSLRATHTFVNDFLFNTPNVIRSTHIATLLPLQEGASNYLQRVSTGMVYQMQSSTINTGGIQVSSITVSSAVVFQREVTFGTRRFVFPDSLGTNGQFLGTDGGGNLDWATASGGTTSPSTKTFTFYGDGDVFLATNTFSPLGLSMSVSKSTWNVKDVRAGFTFKGSRTATMFRLAESTATTGGHDNWTYITPQVVVTTDTNFSSYISTSFAMQPDKHYALHCTTAPVDGTIPSQYWFKVRYWAENEP